MAAPSGLTLRPPAYDGAKFDHFPARAADSPLKFRPRLPSHSAWSPCIQLGLQRGEVFAKGASVEI